MFPISILPTCRTHVLVPLLPTAAPQLQPGPPQPPHALPSASRPLPSDYRPGPRATLARGRLRNPRAPASARRGHPPGLRAPFPPPRGSPRDAGAGKAAPAAPAMVGASPSG